MIGGSKLFLEGGRPVQESGNELLLEDGEVCSVPERKVGIFPRFLFWWFRLHTLLDIDLLDISLLEYDLNSRGFLRAIRL